MVSLSASYPSKEASMGFITYTEVVGAADLLQGESLVHVAHLLEVKDT